MVLVPLGLLMLLLPLPELMPLLDPVVPLFAASGYFFISAEHCASLCIALGDMSSHFCHCVFSALVMSDAEAAKPAPANATVMQVPRAKVANVFIGFSFPVEGTGVCATGDKRLRMRSFLCSVTREKNSRARVHGSIRISSVL